MPLPPEQPAHPARVAVCMAVYRPVEERFRRQVDSLRHQSVTDWHCWMVDDGSDEPSREVLRRVVGTDPRFTVVHETTNVGFYGNFERALSRLPPGPRWVALADQDDHWAPDKLEVLLRAAEADPGATLVYADVEIADEHGAVLSPTYWVGRRHNESDLTALLFANTVTGAASLVRRDVLTAALPFPPRYPSSFHDHWLALVARCTGRVLYVDRALQTYVQHGSNEIGHQPGRLLGTRQLLLRAVGGRWRHRTGPRYYDDEVARISDLARTLLARLGDRLPPPDREVLQRAGKLDTARPPLAWLVAQAFAETRDPSVTMERRRRVLSSVLMTQALRLRSAVRRSRS